MRVTDLLITCVKQRGYDRGNPENPSCVDKLYALTFANRTLSDEWWRAACSELGLQKNGEPTSTGTPVAILRRISPQLYNYTTLASEGTTTLTFLRGQWSNRFAEHMFIRDVEQSATSTLTTMPVFDQKYWHSSKDHGYIPSVNRGMEGQLSPCVGTEPVSGKWYAHQNPLH